MAGFCRQAPAQPVQSVFFPELLKTSFAGDCKICDFPWAGLRKSSSDNSKWAPNNDPYKDLAGLAREGSPEQPLILQSTIIMQTMIVQPEDTII